MEEILRIRMKRLNETTQMYELTKKVKKGYGSLPTFVEGLIASSSLIEEIKQDLSPEYSIRWGQVINSKDELSKEIDAIIFEGRPYYEWQNIGYALIPLEQVKAVVEVNTWVGSGVSSIAGYANLYKQLTPFSPKIFLFCFDCIAKEDKTVKDHRKRIIGYGFNDVFFLRKSLDDEIVFLEDDWFRFVQTMKKL